MAAAPQAIDPNQSVETLAATIQLAAIRSVVPMKCGGQGVTDGGLAGFVSVCQGTPDRADLAGDLGGLLGAAGAVLTGSC